MTKRFLLFCSAAIIAWAAPGTDASAQEMNFRQATQLGKAVYNGDQTALAQLKNSAKTGSADAGCILGALYQAGASVKKDYPEAIKWFLMAAEQGNSEAQFGLGVMFANGYGTPQDYSAAALWFRKAAGQGNPAPNFYLGLLYENGLGVSKNYAEAAKWYTRAAGAPNTVGLQFDLETGSGKEFHAPEDSSQVIRVFPMVLDQSSAHAAYNLGMMYWNGRGVPENKQEAYKWFTVAAGRGSRLAEYNMRILSRQISPKQVTDAVALAAAWTKTASPNAGKPIIE